MAKQIKTRHADAVDKKEEVEEIGEINDIACTDCGRQYSLVVGSSNCRCKACNTLYKHNHPKQFARQKVRQS